MSNSASVEGYLHVEGFDNFERDAFDKRKIRAGMRKVGFPIKTLANGRDMTVTCEFNNGRVYVLSGAYLVDEPSFKADDGTVELQFDGIKGSWQ